MNVCMWVGVSVGALVSVSTSILFDCSGACTPNCVHMRVLFWVIVGVGVFTTQSSKGTKQGAGSCLHPALMLEVKWLGCHLRWQPTHER